MVESKSYQLNKEDMKKLGNGLLIAVVGAVLTYLEGTVPFIDFGAMTPLAVAGNSVIVNLVRKYVMGK